VKIIGCITQQHDLRLVLLAALICATACFTSFNMLSRAAVTTRLARASWVGGAAFAFGLGVWATHFVAELAFEPGLPVSYEFYATLLSATIAIIGALIAQLIYLTAPEQGFAVAASGLVLAAAIGAMHFTGMAAMRVPGSIDFNARYVAAALLDGGLLCMVALKFGAPLHKLGNRLLGAGCLCLAICSLHFIGMAAVTIVPGSMLDRHETLLASGPLAVIVATVTIAILVLSLSGSVLDQHLSALADREAQRLRQLAEATFEGILIHRQGTVLDANNALCRLIGTEVGQVRGRSVLDFVAPGSAELVRERLRTLERQGKLAGSAEIELLTVAGETLPVEILSRSIEHDGRPATVVALRDLSERKRAEDMIRHLAHHDALTALPNRFLFADRLSQALEMAGRAQHGLAVLCIDLDRFKFVNDLLGHQGGDQLLKQVAERLRAAIRSMDTVARLGGDEFAIVQPLTEGPDAAASLAARLVEALSLPFEVDGQQMEIGASIGISIFPGDGDTGPKLLKNADTALYRAKRDGRGRFCFFEPGMDMRLQERRALEQDLRHALDRGEMDVEYQPLFDCRSGDIEGFEALLRWNHPIRGRVAPTDFIPVAEESGLIAALGQWVLQTACAEAASWSRPLRIAVNLSPTQFRQHDLPAIVAAVLARTGLAAHRLELEVTESLLIDDTAHALEILNQLKRLGARISLDDFGTGYSSLSYLRRFPFDKLKIDKSFVQAFGEDQEAAAIIRAIVALGRSLHLSVTAEGVETAAQLELLQKQQCNQVQGFLLSRPLSAAQLASLVAASPSGDEPPARLPLDSAGQPLPAGRARLPAQAAG